ncbi:hypothetical protein [Ottowia sp.]|uniref:hypothetical protein n=1 Tax=Ottowia sp. TaxID=1898956 RepID=UPI003A8C6C51
MSMLVPDYWAEGRAQARAPQNAGGQQVTVRRFGWSMHSALDAQKMADERAQQALARALAGEAVQRRERKLPYGAGDGLPIREEVVSRHGDEVITRNSYGALCLNTPQVLFADVDTDPFAPPPGGKGWLAFVLGALVGALALWALRMPLSAVLWLGVMFASGMLAAGLYSRARWTRWERSRPQRMAAARTQALAGVDAFVAARPGWGVRVYDTPAGLRLLATHRTFAPDDPEVQAFFSAAGADPHYVALCRVQQCFRARLTGKPWRMGLDGRPGAWPAALAQQAARNDWLRRYDAAAAQFAACRLSHTLGHTLVALGVAPVIDLHDQHTRAERTDLPLA